ncbi:hypothetical protein SAMN05421504_102941 [Amycolatopsis xylanica]|uniref:Uncharacterized protein n=1 Tax=Amycolatopsis xylanica TaxID=589385 RepID=A0A1H3AL69_9PSEU|nr:hypothetical protein [Amycolatopsis xylanica]SDX29569.1 hypothetical protein SAMN05421504_102941 [Amycolatopsis xylanica]
MEERPLFDVIETPLGVVGFSCRLGGGKAKVDLRIGPIEPDLPAVYPPVTLWAAVWHVVARDPVPEVTLTAALTGIPDDAVGDYDTGERLDAFTFETADVAVTLGGPDFESVHEDAALGEYLPSRWVGELDEFPVEMAEPARLIWRLPGLEPGESVRLAVAVAWAEPDEEYLPTYSAVSISTEYALRQLAP